MSTNSKNHLALVDYIKHNQNKFYKVAYSYTKSREDSLDIVQETIYKALKSSKGIKQSQYISTWFYRILINTSITHINNRKPVVTLEHLENHVTAIEPREEILDLYDAIDTLNEKDKTFIILRFFEDLRYKDISDICNLNINTVKTRIYTILKKLKLHLDCEGDENE